jgi:hypothetical protein
LLSGAYTYFGNGTATSFNQQLAIENNSKTNQDVVSPQNLDESSVNDPSGDATIFEKQTGKSGHIHDNQNNVLTTKSARSATAQMPAQESSNSISKGTHLRMTSTDYGKSLKEVMPAAKGGYASFNTTSRANQSGAEEIKSPLVKEDKSLLTAALLSEEETKKEKENDKGTEQFWTAVGFAAGTFSNTTPSSPSVAAGVLNNSFAGQTAAAESNSPGYTYTVNLMVGTKVSQRWLIQGGMSYISQTSDYTATSVVADPVQQTLRAASINQFEKNSDTKSNILTTSPYSVNNNIQLISFPMQAGYIVIDRKVGFQINSGFSTDLFLQNTITPQVENLEKSTQGRGDDSPYKAFNISGLIGTELSYRFGDQYRLAVSPGLRYPFSSIYKTDLGVKSSPLTFDVALRFRYILK